MRRIGFGMCLVGFVLAVLAGVLGAVHWIGTDGELYYRYQMEEEIPEYAGISEEELLGLDGCLADYLGGDPQALDGLAVSVFGELQPAFNGRETLHMEDCFKLFVLLRRVLAGAAVLAVLMVGLGAYLLRDRRRIRLAAWLALPVLLIPLGIFALWAVQDFNAAFTFFHEMLFTNDLWLLDPDTDLLIRICPSGMFMKMGARIGLTGLGAALAVPVLTTALTAGKERG